METELSKNKKTIKITTSRNFRDLTASRKPANMPIRTGMLLRSAHLDNLDNDEKREIHSLGIKTVIDFRRTEEQLTPIPEGLEHVSMVHIPIGDVKHDDKRIKKTSEGKIDLGSLMTTHEMINIDQLWSQTCDRYEEKIVKYRDELVQAVSVCTDINRLPVLFHCAGGKDRTGILAALLLAILGYDNSQIMKDYLQTNERPPNSSLPHNYDISNVPKEIWSAIQQARPEFLQRALDTIKRDFGTVENYVTEGTGISEEQLSSFRNFMLSPESNM